MKNILCVMAMAALVVTIGGGCASSRPARVDKVANPLKVAVYADKGPSGIGAVEWFRLVHESPDMELKLVDGDSVRRGGLDGQDVLVMPGWNSIHEFRSLGPEGIEKMKAFIREGGAYLGTCAGCCLLMDGKRRAHVIPWNERGSESATLFPSFKVTEAGAKAMGISAGNHKMRYHGGPFMWPTTNVIDGAKFELWATCDAQASMRGPVNLKKRMYGSAAIVGGTYGKGKVFVTIAHPEYFEATHYVVKGAFRYLTGREVTFRLHQRKAGDVAVGYYAAGIVGIQTAQTALELADTEGVDFQPIDNDGIWEGRLRYLDAVVVPVPITKGVRAELEAFQKRGGKIMTVGSGNSNKIPGAIACASADEILKEVRNIK